MVLIVSISFKVENIELYLFLFLVSFVLLLYDGLYVVLYNDYISN